MNIGFTTMDDQILDRRSPYLAAARSWNTAAREGLKFEFRPSDLYFIAPSGTLSVDQREYGPARRRGLQPTRGRRYRFDIESCGSVCIFHAARYVSQC